MNNMSALFIGWFVNPFATLIPHINILQWLAEVAGAA